MSIAHKLLKAPHQERGKWKTLESKGSISLILLRKYQGHAITRLLHLILQEKFICIVLALISTWRKEFLKPVPLSSLQAVFGTNRYKISLFQASVVLALQITTANLACTIKSCNNMPQLLPHFSLSLHTLCI